MHKIINIALRFFISIFTTFCLCGITVAADDTSPAKPITPDSVPNKIKALTNSDGTLKLKDSAASTSAGPTARSTTKTATPSGKDALSQDELVERITKKLAELRKENALKPKAQVQARKKTAPATPSGVSHTPNLAGDATTSHDVPWSYDGDGGPAHWGEIDPANVKCATGKRQSPIDIRDGIRVDLEPVAFDYKPARFNIIDNEHTIQVNLSAGNNITILGRRYELIQFHFHKPSEEKINGVGYDMVIHLVHKDMDGKLVVLAILVQPGKANNLVQTIWNNMPLEKNDMVQPPSMIDMNQILPADRKYYTYMGSLTTPPCTEGVLWIVFKEPIELSQDQISIFGHIYPMNARPVQNSAGRLIKASE